MITVNQIYNNIINNLPNIYVTKYFERITEALPCVYIRESHSPIESATNLNFSDKQVRMYLYVEVYGEETEGIVEQVEAIMRNMGFLEELSEMIPNYDPSIERVSMRFQRVICDGDTILTLDGTDDNAEGENP